MGWVFEVSKPSHWQKNLQEHPAVCQAYDGRGRVENHFRIVDDGIFPRRGLSQWPKDPRTLRQRIKVGSPKWLWVFGNSIGLCAILRQSQKPVRWSPNSGGCSSAQNMRSKCLLNPHVAMVISHNEKQTDSHSTCHWPRNLRHHAFAWHPLQLDMIQKMYVCMYVWMYVGR
jgi:hypothetical protein